MWGELHILTGMVLQRAGSGRLDESLVWPIAASVLSHPVIDSLNWSEDADSLYHGLGTGRLKWLGLGIRIGLDAILAWWLIRNPALLICGMIAWLCWDWEHGLRLIFKKDLRLHERMYPAWLKSEAGLFLVLLGMGVLLGLIWSSG